MKRFILLAVLIYIVADIQAQQEYEYFDEPGLLERVANLENKTGKFNFYLNMQNSFDLEINKDGLNQGKFYMRQMRIEAKGDINDWLSYRWRQRLNKPNNASKAIDNMPTSIDYAAIGVKLSDKFSLFIGKQGAAYGGIEFNLNPIEIYEYSDMITNLPIFLTGATVIYDLTPNQQFKFQILNGLNDSFEDTYSPPPGIEKSKLPLLYTLNWNGNLFNGVYKPRWSVSTMSEAKDKNILYVALGNDITFTPGVNMFFDVMYSKEDLDRNGIISKVLNDGAENVLNTEYLSLVTKFNFRVHPLWNIFVQGLYETASLSKGTETHEKGKYRTSWGYLTGVEYYPMKSNLHFFLTYVGRSVLYENKAGLKDYHTNRISTGFIYQLPLF